jgi:hypothetical protein
MEQDRATLIKKAGELQTALDQLEGQLKKVDWTAAGSRETFDDTMRQFTRVGADLAVIVSAAGGVVDGARTELVGVEDWGTKALGVG